MCQGSKKCDECTLSESKIGKMKTSKMSIKAGLGTIQPAGEIALGMVLSSVIENYLPGSPLVKNITKVASGAFVSLMGSTKSPLVLIGAGMASHGLLGISKQYIGIGSTASSGRSSSSRSSRSSTSSSASRRMATA